VGFLRPSPAFDEVAANPRYMSVLQARFCRISVAWHCFKLTRFRGGLMQRSTDRILTTHAGSLPRPEDVIERGKARPLRPTDALGWSREMAPAVAAVVARQLDTGVDIINDGEYGKATRNSVDYGAWSSYAYERIAGWQPAPPDTPAQPSRRERRLFPGTYDEMARGGIGGQAGGPPLFTGPISYRGQEAVQADIANLKAAMSGRRVTEAFITAVSVGSFARRENRYYKDDEAYLFALADAFHEEYKAITDAGFVLQLDEPGMATIWDMFDPEPPLEEYKQHLMLRVEAINHALRDIPEDMVRFHVCWGSWHGPHSTDIALRDIVDVILRIKAGAYSVEAGNVRHEHEWKVWRDVKLPEGKTLIPGVVSHATNVVEHPEVVADRIVRYANAVGRANVVAGTDCGLGGRVHPELAWAKLGSLVEGARLASKELWG
jgi:5-methyltetrahydropteroyltriglutamate--homocysteine methyltransferase